jgi:hypothetical protein
MYSGSVWDVRFACWYRSLVYGREAKAAVHLDRTSALPLLRHPKESLGEQPMPHLICVNDAARPVPP